MERKFDIIVNREKLYSGLYDLVSGENSETAVLFEQENVVAVIERNGTVKFYNTAGEPIAAGKAPVEKSGMDAYEKVGCWVKENRIELRFPNYKWIDNYPNCDGESDRWDAKIVGYYTMTLDLSTNTVQ